MSHDNTKYPESYFLNLFFDGLKQHHIPYAVLRNYETLPFTAGGSDIDIILFDKIDQAITFTLSCVFLSGGILFGSVSSPGFQQFAFLGKQSCKNSQWWGQLIDISASTYKGLPLIDVDLIRSYVVEYKGVSVLDARIACANAFVKMYLARGSVDEKYKAHYATVGALNYDEFRKIFHPLGAACCRMVYEAISGRAMRLFRLRIFLSRLFFHLHSLSKSPFFYTKNRILYELSRLHRYFSPPGLTIAILGVDGAGKSTVINALLPALNAATHNAVVVRHLRPTLLPPLARFKGKKNPLVGQVVNPHGSTPAGRLGSLFRLAYLTLDYVLGNWLWVRPIITKKPSVVLFDRYAYDMALDPARFRIGLSTRVVQWFAALAPKPDLIICLYGTPEVIAARKNELSVEETCRQVEALKDFAIQEPRAVLVTTDTSIEETRDQVLHALMTYLQTKTAQRH